MLQSDLLFPMFTSHCRSDTHTDRCTHTYSFLFASSSLRASALPFSIKPESITAFFHTAHEVISPFWLIKFTMLHALLLYPHKTQASPCRHAQWTCNDTNLCSVHKDKGTRYMHWASATTRSPVPSKPCRNILPAECFPISKSILAA